jgi:hypothetical protein
VCLTGANSRKRALYELKLGRVLTVNNARCCLLILTLATDWVAQLAIAVCGCSKGAAKCLALCLIRALALSISYGPIDNLSAATSTLNSCILDLLDHNPEGLSIICTGCNPKQWSFTIHKRLSRYEAVLQMRWAERGRACCHRPFLQCQGSCFIFTAVHCEPCYQ